jgi:hypothetical protein
MPVTALVAIDRARTLLNDPSAQTWTDARLMLFLAVAFPELQTILKKARCPIMRTISAAVTVTAGATSTGSTLTDLVEPIKLWENAVGSPRSTASEMTEVGVLPQLASAATLRYWSWNGATIDLIAASANRDVFVQYWRSIAIPGSTAASLVIPEAEMYIGPRLAGLASSSVGGGTLGAEYSGLALEAINQIIAVNKGQKMEAKP